MEIMLRLLTSNKKESDTLSVVHFEDCIPITLRETKKNWKIQYGKWKKYGNGCSEILLGAVTATVGGQPDGSTWKGGSCSHNQFVDNNIAYGVKLQIHLLNRANKINS